MLMIIQLYGILLKKKKQERERERERERENAKCKGRTFRCLYTIICYTPPVFQIISSFHTSLTKHKLDVTKSVKLLKWMFKNALFIELNNCTHSTDINGEWIPSKTWHKILCIVHLSWSTQLWGGLGLHKMTTFLSSGNDDNQKT